MEITGNYSLDLGKEELSLWRIVWLVLPSAERGRTGGWRRKVVGSVLNKLQSLQKSYIDQRSLLKYEFISIIINDEPSLEMPTTDSCAHM